MRAPPIYAYDDPRHRPPTGTRTARQPTAAIRLYAYDARLRIAGREVPRASVLTADARRQSATAPGHIYRYDRATGGETLASNTTTTTARWFIAPNSGDFDVSGKASQFGNGTLLKPGMVPTLDAALKNDNFVNQLGVLYGLNKNYGVQTNGGSVDVTEFFATLNGGSATSDRLYSNTITLSQSTFDSGGWTASVTPSFTTSDLLGVAHTHPIEGVPSDGHDFSWQVPALSSRGVWSVVVTPSTIYFTGPQQGQYYYLPTSAFTSAGQANGKTVTIPAEPPHGP